ncbi:hypothetical protein PBN151_3208 [Paenibacillus sp. NAIST15-1]|nr:hypothetical protein PBN151_3208 [Paenibacillus sp. NAIST15-1]
MDGMNDDEQGKRKHCRCDDGVQLQDGAHAPADEPIGTNQCKQQTNLVIQMQILHEHGSCSCQHYTIDANNNDHRE